MNEHSKENENFEEILLEVSNNNTSFERITQNIDTFEEDDFLPITRSLNNRPRIRKEKKRKETVDEDSFFNHSHKFEKFVTKMEIEKNKTASLVSSSTTLRENRSSQIIINVFESEEESLNEEIIHNKPEIKLMSRALTPPPAVKEEDINVDDIVIQRRRHKSDVFEDKALLPESPPRLLGFEEMKSKEKIQIKLCPSKHENNRINHKSQTYKIFISDKFEKIFKHFCDLRRINFDDILFFYNFTRLSKFGTPESLKMKDKIIVDVVTKDFLNYIKSIEKEIQNTSDDILGETEILLQDEKVQNIELSFSD